MADPAAAPATNAPPEKMSKGEKVFNWLTYGGIGYVFTFLATVPIAWALQYHSRMAPRFTKMAERLVERGWAKNADGANKLLQTVTLHFGGLIGIPFVWAAEKFKVPFVQSWNRTHGDATDPAAIAAAPKQTIWTLIGARITAWATVWVSLSGGGKLFPKSFQTFETEFADKFCRLLGKPARVGVPAALIAEHGQLRGEIDALRLRGLTPGETLGKAWEGVEKRLAQYETTHFQVGRIASLDIFATAASATLLYAVSRVFARKREQHIEKREYRLAAEKEMHADAVPTGRDDGRPQPRIDAAGAAVQKMAAAPELHAQL
ncbi:MAG: hypothetical protein WDN72_01680 [Alphaproteobacteria bacterium]